MKKQSKWNNEASRATYVNKQERLWLFWFAFLYNSVSGEEYLELQIQ